MLVPLINATFTPPVTSRPAPDSTRKPAAPAPALPTFSSGPAPSDRPPLGTSSPPAALAPLLLIAALFAGGCATPGPLHVYSLEGRGVDRVVRDHGNGTTATVPGFLAADDTVTGFAYDPFTDHFFLRLAPGNAIRVVDRPARAIKREFAVDGLPASGGGDLALRPRDGHLFFLAPAGEPPAVYAVTRYGKLLRRFDLAGHTAPPIGIAFDVARDQLLVLAADGRRVIRHDLQGARLGELTLAAPAGPGLAFDSDTRVFYAPLRADPSALGTFDETGRALRPAPGTGAFVDVGQRSLIRVF
jgi:hypothetical protein